MYLQHMKSSWAPATIDMLETELENAQMRNANLGLPAFHEINDTGARMAAEEARKLIESGLPDLVQTCCRDVLHPLQVALMDQICANMTFDRPELVSAWLKDQETAILNQCRQAAQSIQEQIVKGVREMLFVSDTGPFRLNRFPQFLEAIMVHANSMYDSHSEKLLSAVTSCINKFFAEMSPWVSIRTDLDSKQAKVSVSYKCDVLVENIVFSFIRNLPCLELLNELPNIAESVPDWIESCSTDRITFVDRMLKLKEAETGIAKMVEIDLSAILIHRKKVQFSL
jgi:hypothetical protein